MDENKFELFGQKKQIRVWKKHGKDGKKLQGM